MKNKLFGISSLLALSVPAALFTIVPSAQAIVVIVGSTASSAATTATGAIDHIVDQTGLSAPYISGVTDFDSYVRPTTHDSVPDGTTWTYNGVNAVITFDLGTSYKLNALALWSLDSTNASSGVRDFDLYADIDADPSSLGTLLGSFNASTFANPVQSQVFDFTVTDTQYIQMQVNSNGGATTTGLGEVAFRAVPWETDVLSVIGTTLLFAGGVWTKRKSAKPLDKE